MARKRYVPERGDYVWVDLQPHHGHEQGGHRPALVLSPQSYNRKTGLCVICPATRQMKGYAFEVPGPSTDGVQGVILADHVRTIDWRTRRVRFITRAVPETLAEVIARLESLIIDPDE